MTSQGQSALSARSIPVNAPGRFAFLDLPPWGDPQSHAPKARFKGMTPAVLAKVEAELEAAQKPA